MLGEHRHLGWAWGGAGRRGAAIVVTRVASCAEIRFIRHGNAISIGYRTGLSRRVGRELCFDSIREGCELYRLDATLASSAHAPLLHTALVSDEGKAVVKHVDEIVGPG